MLKNPTRRDGPWHEVTPHRSIQIRLPMTLEEATAWADRLFPNREEKRIFKTDVGTNPQDYQTLSQIVLTAIRNAHTHYLIAVSDAHANKRRVDTIHTMDRIHDLDRRSLDTSRAHVRRHCADARVFQSIIVALTAEWQSLQSMLVEDVAALENWADTYLVDDGSPS